MTANETPCYGLHWDISAKECSRCFVKTKCERLTKMRQSGQMPEPSVPEIEEPIEAIEEPEELAPIEHLLQSLSGKFDRKDRSNETATAHYFNKDGKLKVLVIVADSGRVQVKAKGYERIFDGIESVAQAEEIVAAVV